MPPNVSLESVEDYIFSQFPGWTWFQRVRETNFGSGTKVTTFSATQPIDGCVNNALNLLNLRLHIFWPPVYRTPVSIYDVGMA
jgi:hypothetical protein